MKERGEGEVGGMKRSRKRGKGKEGRVGERISAQKIRIRQYTTHIHRSPQGRQAERVGKNPAWSSVLTLPSPHCPQLPEAGPQTKPTAQLDQYCLSTAN